jgi:outer membrane protein assembly factor BamB
VNRTARLATALAALGAAACGGPALQTVPFSPDWQSDGGKQIQGVADRMEKVRVPEGRGIAVGLTQTGLVAVGLDGTHKWTHQDAVDSRPSIAGGVVVYTTRGTLVALSADTGAVLWKINVGDKRLRGAGDDGQVTAVSLGSPSGGGTLLLAVNRNGVVERQFTPQPEVGVPAVADGTLFAPWGSQYVSALDLKTGEELGRVLARTVVSRAMAIGGSIYFGENALVRFDPAITKSSQNGANIVKLPERELPGKPMWFPNGATVLPPQASAPDSIRLYARPTEAGGKVAVDSGRFVGTYFRIIVGFNAEDGALRWVRTLPDEVIGGDAASGGFVLCDEKGNVWFTGARSGGDAGHVALGQPVKSCAVSAGSFKVEGGRNTSTLPEQITQALDQRETQMATIQRFLLRELGTSDDPSVTKTLLDLASDARTEPELLDEARNLLAARRTGVDLMVEALGRHYDFLSDVLRPPPVAPLADALSAVGERRAAPLLASHLNDPSDSPKDVRHAARALVTLASPSELGQIRTFFSLYRATADENDLVAAVIDAARILVKLGDAGDTELVQRAAQDPLTNPAVREGIASLAPTAGETPKKAAGDTPKKAEARKSTGP